MTHEQLLSPALRSELSAFLADAIAKADLPPLTREQDILFVHLLLEGVIDAFWEAYTGQLGDAARKQLQDANADETGGKIWQWMQEYADFGANAGARLLAEEVMNDFGTRLPDIITEAHKQFEHPDALDLPLPV